ncbi:hypothetical protein LGH83_13550 [Lichenihabitans sp. PAMC28606]|jgi:hypothetical protein|uniref:hypothetical protein n=1 Tax=Lichenihabitans sp. PAMC28606 TaxID=2880932 RepID=UPI001D09A041|nr:hypothetical protein [Lichenihabitans sp. PAMC28606]UDL93593.1 hypothetical protein LGH83_13550 [Lichenihabitans sp. PAMC28606]
MLFFEEIAMFQVQAPVVIVPSAEARAALGVQLRPAALAAWREIARRGQGIEMAHFQIVHTGVTLAVCSHIRSNGFIEIGIGLGDPRQAGRVIPAAQLRQAEARAQSRRGQALRRY